MFNCQLPYQNTYIFFIVNIIIFFNLSQIVLYTFSNHLNLMYKEIRAFNKFIEDFIATE